MTKKTYEDGLPLGVIGIFNFREITDLQIMVPMGLRTKYEAVMRAKDRTIVARVEFAEYLKLRSHLAEEMHIGLKYTDCVLDATLDFNKRFEAARAENKPSSMLSQYESRGVTYSVIHHPAQHHVHYNPAQDRIEPEFYRAVAQHTAVEDPDECLIFDEVVDTLFDAVVVIRTHIEKDLINTFMKGTM
ncbi:hypothetical protein CNR34_00131 [Pseudomonas phage nickie]|uniref:Uncharacterized protein n=1 Tax=Pseudomonas phage nickie TaxID=2048977 RepID=A0A2H4P793_9CAUD|nr:hypothetical protein FDJ16_gp034 [Pseudomonas phage nickie]ATW58064.1 hypothetical protein CNR34_00131 [Pseudomonas phage nickie]